MLTGVFPINKRVVARARSSSPLLFYLPFLILGQLNFSLLYLFASYKAGTYINLPLQTPFLILALVYFAYKFKRYYLVSFLVGFISACFGIPNLSVSINSDLLRMVVDEEPRFKRPGEVELSVTDIDSGDRLKCKSKHLPWLNIFKVEKGSLVHAKITLVPLEPTLDPFGYSYNLLRHGYVGTCKIKYVAKLTEGTHGVFDLLKANSISKVKSILGDNETAGLFLAMSLGIRDQISERTERAFKKAGTSHLLVLSGYQVTLVYYGVFIILWWCITLSPKLCSYISANRIVSVLATLVSVLFVFFVGIEGSSLRAAFGIIFIMISKTLERGGGLFNSCLVALFALSIIWPGCYLEPGVQLTFSALLGIIIGYSRNSSNFVNYIRVSTYATLFASFFVLIWFDQISVLGFIINPLLSQIISFISCNLGLVALLLLDLGDSRGIFLQIVARAIEWFREFVIWSSSVWWSAFEVTGREKEILCIFYGAFLGWIVLRKVREFREENNLN